MKEPRKTILTPREKQVLFLIVREGMETRDIAKELGLTARGVGGHKYSLYDKTGYSTGLEVAVAFYNGKLDHLLSDGEMRR